MNYLNVMLLADFYKISHRSMYPVGMEVCYSTWTPRTSRLNVEFAVSFGQQAFIKNYLIKFFNDNFFNKPKEKIVKDYARTIKYTLGVSNPETKHIEDLHDLGYLPLSIKSLPEGTLVPLKVPMMTIENTKPEFFWLTNYIETLASCSLWQASTSATIAYNYKKLLTDYAMKTVGNADFVAFQGHDFSMRGQSSLESAILSGMAHLLSFVGTDTIPAITALEHLYNANIEKELVGTSVPATEHSIQCAYGDDMAYLKRMITEVHPSGIVSVVSDGYDFWDVIGRVIPALKTEIMNRKGGTIVDKVVIRPDSGDPVLILTGDPNGKTELERKGAVEALWDIFGGTVSPMGYKMLDSHIGLIYGDAITYDRAKEICEKLANKGFASTNVVYGIGSFTYQYNTRDTLGFALKSTFCKINGVDKQIFKDPKTDNGVKKSLKGKVAVIGLHNGTTGEFVNLTSVSELGSNDVVEGDLLKEIYRDGKLLVDDSLSTIRGRLYAT